MTVFDALATAIRERLISGRPAPLPGLGTLVRQHVSARIEERPDGTRMLLPPGETIGLAETEESHESLAAAFGRLQALPVGEAEDAYTQAMDQLEARLSATGEVRLPGVGLLRRTSGGVVLGVEAELLSAVNRAYEGLAPVGTDPTSGSAAGPGDGVSPVEPVAEDTSGPSAPPSPEADTSVEESADVAPEEAADAEDDGVAPPVDPEVTPIASEEADRIEATPPSDEVPAPPADEMSDETIEEADVTTPDAEPGIAVPFGAPSSDAQADVLPPTPPEADPSLASEDDDWTSETWTSGTTAASGSLLGARPPDLIEDADFEVLPPEPSAPTIERVSPEAETEAMLSASREVPPPVPPPSPEPVTTRAADPVPEAAVATPDDDSGSGNALGWILGVVVVALLAAALWAWSSRDDASAADPEPVVTTTPPTTAPSAATADPDTTPRPDAAEPVAGGPDDATDGAPAPASASASEEAPPSQAPAPSSASSAAVSPPRLDGLDDGDRRAIAGGPIDPAMGGWTIVVASLRSEEAANAESALYAEAGYRTGVFPPSERGQTRYRVGVGQFGSEAHARRLRDRLPPRAPADAWVLNLRTL